MEEITLAQKVRFMFKKMEDIRKPYEADWENIAKYVLYRREFFDFSQAQGQGIAKDKFDGTAGKAANNLIHGFQGYMVSRSIKWLNLEFENEELENYKEATIWLEDELHYLYEVFSNTNFYDMVNENLADAVAFGTPCMYSENDPTRNQIFYSERHPIEIYVSKNRYGVHDIVFRKYKMSAREIVKQFDKKNISKKIVDGAEKPAEMFNEHVIIHGVFPNDERVLGKLNSKNKKYRSVYLEEQADEDNITLSDKGYDDNPYTTWCWNENSTEDYGRSPSHDALPEVLTANQLEKSMLEAVEKSVNPPMYVPGKNRGRIRTYPGGHTYYENYEAERMEPVYQGINLPVGMDERNDLRDRIRGHYFNEFFLILNQLIQEKGSNKTATEIMEIQGEKAAIINPIIGRYETKFLDSIINRTYQIEYEARRGPPMPAVLEDRGEEKIKIRYTGPLATIQERLYKTTGVVHTLNSIGPIADIQMTNAPILDKFDFDVLADEISDVYEMPRRAIRTDKEVQKIREQRAKANQAAQQAELAEKMGKAAQGLGKAPEAGSPVEKLMEG